MIKKVWNFLIAFLGYLLLLLILIVLAARFIWYPIKLGNYEHPAPFHLQQKQDYLKSVPNKQDEKPNLVVIFFDDLGYGDLGCYGNPLIETPYIDNVASSGIRFTDFYSSSPVCTPSRAGLLTGRLPIRALAGDHVYFPEGHMVSNFRKVRGSVNELPRDEILLPEVLKAAGYRTGIIGKWHLGDIEGHLPNDFGFDEYYGVRYSNDMLPLHIFRNDQIEEEDKTELLSGSRAYLDPDEALKVMGVDQSQLTHNYTREGIRFIEKNKEQAFFLYMAHSFPHVPHFASPEHKGKSKAGLYGDVVEDLDRSVGAIMETLKTNGLEENTLVIITSDNGADYNGSAGNLRGRKGDSFDGGQRVPMIVSWKGSIAAGQETEAIAMNTDLFPTMLQLLNIGLPSDRIIDGQDIFPVFSGQPSPHEYIYYTHAASGKLAGIRNQQFKYHEGGFKAMPAWGMLGFVQKAKPQLNDIQLGNESHNLTMKYPEIATRMQAELNRKMEEIEGNQRGWTGLNDR